MSMSKKDYETVAACIKVQTFEQPIRVGDENAHRLAGRSIAEALALEFSLDNPRFSQGMFMEACGFSDHGHDS